MNKPENERLAVVETRVDAFEKAVERLSNRLNSLLDKLDTILTRHEQQIKASVAQEMSIYKKEFNIMKMKLKQLEVLLFFSKYPKLAIFIAMILYLFAISDVRDYIFKIL